MTSFLQRLETAQRPLLWIEASAYAGRLLAQGQVPWLDAAAYVAWLRKAQALLGSDVVGVPCASLCEAWVDAHEELRVAMAAKRRTTHALRTLLGAEELRGYVRMLVRDLRATFPEQTLALVLPAPRRWVGEAHALAHAGVVPEVEDDEAESAAVYVADFLRAFADTQVNALLLQEPTTTQQLRMDDPSYGPIANVCAHYRWDLGVQGPATLSGENPGMAFVIVPETISFPVTGMTISSEAWERAIAPQGLTPAFWFAQIPEGSDPERVLESLAILRAMTRTSSAAP